MKKVKSKNVRTRIDCENEKGEKKLKCENKKGENMCKCKKEKVKM